jgi:hypothetical protein
LSYNPVYSAQFINYAPAAPNDTFAVPVGFTAVIRQISYAVYASATVLAVRLQNTASAPTINIDIREILATVTTTNIQGHWVCPGGGFISLYIQSVGAEPNVYVGGYLLRNTAS